MPLYINAESTLIMSQGRFSVKAKAKSVFPAAVGPIKQIAKGKPFIEDWSARSSFNRASSIWSDDKSATLPASQE